MAYSKAVAPARTAREGPGLTSSEKAMNQRRWDQIEELLQKALDVEPDKRLDFLESACLGDEDLRRRVETLLRGEDEARSFIETPAVAYQAPPTGTGSSLIGESISRYRIESLI